MFTYLVRKIEMKIQSLIIYDHDLTEKELSNILLAHQVPLEMYS